MIFCIMFDELGQKTTAAEMAFSTAVIQEFCSLICEANLPSC